MKDNFFDVRTPHHPHAAPYGREHPGPMMAYPEEKLPLKSKFIATVLSMMIPGTGQMYLGAVVRGMSIMLLLVLNIVSIVFFAEGPVEFNVLPVTLLSLLIPVLYFYNVFDAVHQTDAVNRAIRHGYAFQGPITYPNANGGSLLLGFIGAVVFFCSLSAFGGWWDGLFTVNAAVGGAALLIAGAFLFYKEFRGKKP
ncbi:hypothetical protein FE783_20175 [Paenibacillus mesophilus]|uniref:hypothetical protein n=1 Tax=Paenibacillus mesophilus TaxID=2582849 RepID=UPI00110DB3C1|nr:hypothetical protein [Paenibacillus mesophilus]TMV47756.1 hypothetical protein FE783_20175 [Paenibacillus mesophilus]